MFLLTCFWVPFLLTLLTIFLPPRNFISFSCSLLFRNLSVLFRGSLTMFLQVPILASLVLTYLFIVCFPRLPFLGTSTCSRHFVYTLESFFFELQVFLSDSAPAFFPAVRVLRNARWFSACYVNFSFAISYPCCCLKFSFVLGSDSLWSASLLRFLLKNTCWDLSCNVFHSYVL